MKSFGSSFGTIALMCPYLACEHPEASEIWNCLVVGHVVAPIHLVECYAFGIGD